VGDVGAGVTLFPALSPVDAPPGIDLRCADVRDVAREVRGVSLVHADPPWNYECLPGVANPGCCGIYDVMTDADIAAVLDAAYDCAIPGARLACWATWPKLTEFLRAGGAGQRWEYVTGGAWTKRPHFGVGHHWRGSSEPLLVFRRPGVSYRAEDGALLNAHVSAPEQHSRKPRAWLSEIVRYWTPPGSLVLDLWAGLAPMAAACAAEGRRYVGAEIDPERHGRALTMLRDCP
jgi:hypothetical protein